MTQWLVAGAAIIAIMAGLGSAAAFITVGRYRGMLQGFQARADLLDHDVEDRDRRIEFIEAENIRKGELLKKQRAEIDELHSQIETLKSVVTGEAHYVALHEQLEHNLATIDPKLDKLLTGQKDIMNLVGGRRAANGGSG